MKKILSLGDSYTIGTGVACEESLSAQLVQALRAGGWQVAEPLIIACNGWTTDELEAGILAANPQGPFDLVTLLIGVNNQYRGYPLNDYRTAFTALLARAIFLAGSHPGRVVVLSIPDWGVTPFAGSRDRRQVAAEIDAFNAVNYAEAQKVGALYVDVTVISRQCSEQQGFLAPDELHPSGAMYALWVEKVLKAAAPILR